MPSCLVSVGSNQGDSSKLVHDAIKTLEQRYGSIQFQASHLYETLPIGGPQGQPAYLNAAVRFESSAEPFDLLQGLQEIENEAGRSRDQRWDARTLDLDLIACGKQVLSTPRLRLPHPRLSYRPFVLEPCAEVAPDWVHPELGLSIDQLLRTLRAGEDTLLVIGPECQSVAALLLAELALDTQNRETQYEVKQFQAEAKQPKLTIDTSLNRCMESCGPMLRLNDCPAEAWREEVRAAIQCVWPSAAVPND